MSNPHRGLLASIVFVIFLWALTAFTPQCEPARAQQVNRITPALALARLCVSEAGWECFARGDGYAIHEVILRGAERQDMRYTTFARAYAQRLFGARPHDSARLAWVSQLDERGSAPVAWPRYAGSRTVGGVVVLTPHAPWSSFRARWFAVLERAREVSGWTLEDAHEWSVCDDAVHDWGGTMDRDRAQRIGLIEIRCGIDEHGTRNDFYARPSLLDPANVVIDPD